MGRIFEVRKHTMFARWNRMAKQFSRIGKDITIAVKKGGSDPNANPALRRAIQNSRAVNMPKDKVESAIKRASGRDAANFEEVIYEGYAPHFTQCMHHVGNRAERQRADHRVKAVALKWQVLRIQVMEIDLDAGRGDARLRVAVEVGVRVDGFDAAHGPRIVRQVAAGAEADLKDAPRGSRKRALPRLGQDPAAHGEVEQVREDTMMVEAQGRRSGLFKVVLL